MHVFPAKQRPENTFMRAHAAIIEAFVLRPGRVPPPQVFITRTPASHATEAHKEVWYYARRQLPRQNACRALFDFFVFRPRSPADQLSLHAPVLPARR